MLCGVLNCPGPVAGLAPGLHPVAILVDFRDARIDVAVADVRVARRRPRPRRSPGGTSRQRAAAAGARASAGPVPSSDASCLRPKTITTRPAGIEFDDHVRAFVRGPDIVLRIDLHRVRERPRIEIVADLAQESAVARRTPAAARRPRHRPGPSYCRARRQIRVRRNSRRRPRPRRNRGLAAASENREPSGREFPAPALAAARAPRLPAGRRGRKICASSPPPIAESIRPSRAASSPVLETRGNAAHFQRSEAILRGTKVRRTCRCCSGRCGWPRRACRRESIWKRRRRRRPASRCRLAARNHAWRKR